MSARVPTGQALLCCVLAGLAGARVGAQCDAAWSEGFNLPGVDGFVEALTFHHDGTAGGIYAGGRFTSAGRVVAANIARWDGFSWSALGTGVAGPAGAEVFTLATFNDGGGDALFAGGTFTVAGGFAAGRIARWSGGVWTPVGGGVDGTVRALVVHYAAGVPALFAGGDFTNAGGVPAAYVARWNGSSWSAVGGGPSGPVRALASFDDGTGAALHAGTADGVWRWNGANWTQIGMMQNGIFVPGSGVVRALHVHDDGTGPALYAGGTFLSVNGVQVFNIARWRSAGWSVVGTGLGGASLFSNNDAVYALATLNEGGVDRLFAGGRFNGPPTNLGRWDGTAWTSVGSMFLNSPDTVRALAAFTEAGAISIFAGGDFADIGVPTPGAFRKYGIARWRSGAWSAAGDGEGIARAPLALVQSVKTLSFFDSGTGPVLVAGGSFDWAGSLSVHNLGIWNGSSWIAPPIINGLTSAVTCVVPFDLGAGPRLAIGAGAFCYAFDGVSLSSLPFPNGPVQAAVMLDDGGGPALFAATAGSLGSLVFKWSGGPSSTLVGVFAGVGGGPASVNALCVHDDGLGPALFAAGSFASVGGVPAANIVRRTGNSWQAVSGGAGGPGESVTALASLGGGILSGLYAAGPFTSAGGVPATGIARFDGNQWCAVGGGLSLNGGTPAVVSALAGFDDGTGPKLVAAGGFLQAGSGPASRIARWDGVTWTAIGSGLDGDALALAVLGAGPDSILYVGGAFHVADGVPSVGIARFGRRLPSLSLLQPFGPGGLVVVRDASLIAGHEYYNLFSAEPCPTGPGTGPFFGLCASDLSPLLQQIALPVGSEPFHVFAPAGTLFFGPYVQPAGLILDGLCCDVTGGSLHCVSPVTRIIVQ